MMRQVQQRKWLAGWAFGLTIVLSACSSSAPAPAGAPSAPATARAGGEVVVAEPTVPDTFDPIAHSNFNNWYVWQLSYETLVVLQEDGKIGPMLATSWDVAADGLTYTFKLRSGVKFHNGNVLTSDDVVFSFERLKAKGIPYAQARFPNIASVKALDSSSVEFKLTKRDSSFMNNLGDPFVVAGAILNRQAAGTTDPATKMIGTGPFAMVSYAPGTALVLERNKDYWRTGAPKVDKLTIRYIKEAQSAIAALLAGEVALIHPVPETYLALKSNTQVKVLSVATASTYEINMGSVRPPLNIVDVRRAIALSIDREAVVRTALLGEGVPTGPFPPSDALAVPLKDQPYYQRDVNKAKDLLAKSGFPNGLNLSFMYPTITETMARVAEVLQSQLADSGIRVKLEPLELSVWLDRLVKANYDLTMTAPPYYSDPSLYVVPRAGRQGPTPPELQTLLDKAVASAPEGLAAVYREIQMKEAELVYPFTGVVAENKWVAYRPELVGAVKLHYSLSRRLYFDLERGSK